MARGSVIQVPTAPPDTRFELESMVVDARLWDLVDPGVGQGPATLKEHGLSTTNYSQSTDSRKPALTYVEGIGTCARFVRVSDSEGDWIESPDNVFNDIGSSYTIAIYASYDYLAYGFVVSNSEERIAAVTAGFNLDIDAAPYNSTMFTTANSGYQRTTSVPVASISVIVFCRSDASDYVYFSATQSVGLPGASGGTLTSAAATTRPIFIGAAASSNGSYKWPITGNIRRIIVWKKDLRSNIQAVYNEVTRTDL